MTDIIESLKSPSRHISNKAQYIYILGGGVEVTYPLCIYATSHVISPARQFTTRSKNGGHENFQGVLRNIYYGMEPIRVLSIASGRVTEHDNSEGSFPSFIF